MFDTPAPRIFGLPPGVDFPAALVRGLRARLAGQPPEAMARVELYLNTARMLRAVREAFLEAGPGLLPRLRLVTDIGGSPLVPLPLAIPPLRRRLELARLVAGLLDAAPDLAPRSALYDLSDSLSDLIAEMQGEGVAPEALAALDVSEHSAHWRRTQDFLGIVAPFFGSAETPDAEARQRLAVLAVLADWAVAPPSHPVIVAGSTGSRGTTALFMQAVAALPQGAVVLPGFDTDLPADVWQGLHDPMASEDHPQFRYRRLFDVVGLLPSDVRPWGPETAPRPALNRLVSLSLRPAPVTDRWLVEGPALPDLVAATAHLSLIEADSPRDEAMAIALAMRAAAEESVSVALLSPDRVLTRQVTAALDRWGILPDDSAGRPLALSAPGRLLRHVAALFGQRLTSETLLVLLKHPLAATGSDRGDHLRWTRDLELRLRRNGPVFPTPQDLRDWGAAQAEPGTARWAEWLASTVGDLDATDDLPLADHVTRHVSLCERLASGPDQSGTGALWDREAGIAARAVIDSLIREAPHGGTLSPGDYADLFGAILAAGDVREALQGHPQVRILGPREARECRAERVILGGLNEGIWPQRPAPDPWLNRQMRQAAGLLLPERQIGLSAHDYQQAIARPDVILSRALRDAEAEAVPSRWINRLTNLMSGLPDRDGPEALRAMRQRGQHWLDLARALDAPAKREPAATRPAPRPPVDQRPRELAVTGIRTLIRDPYAIYARHVLRLRRLDPLRHEPDALARGSALHAILERFVRERGPESAEAARSRLLAIADDVLAEAAPWPAARALWRARLDRAAAAFLIREAAGEGVPAMIEQKGRVLIPTLDFTLTARPDRIDELPDGRLHILDYKTGTPPTQKMQQAFDKQLLLEAAMAERGGFAELGIRQVARITYVGLNNAAKIETTELTQDVTDQVWEELRRLISRYRQREQGYASRRAMAKERYPGDYDHLARFGEWDMTAAPVPMDVE